MITSVSGLVLGLLLLDSAPRKPPNGMKEKAEIIFVIDICGCGHLFRDFLRDLRFFNFMTRILCISGSLGFEGC